MCLIALLLPSIIGCYDPSRSSRNNFWPIYFHCFEFKGTIHVFLFYLAASSPDAANRAIEVRTNRALPADECFYALEGKFQQGSCWLRFYFDIGATVLVEGFVLALPARSNLHTLYPICLLLVFFLDDVLAGGFDMFY